MKTFFIEGQWVPASAITGIVPAAKETDDPAQQRFWKIFLSDGRCLKINLGYWDKHINICIVNQLKSYFGIHHG